jgi:hypothetical protein
MRRAQILDLVGLTAGQFDALIARGLAPLSSQRPAKGWATFSADDALRFGLFSALTRAGVSQAQAGAIVRSQYDDLIEYLEADVAADVWFGVFSTTASTEGEPGARGYFPLIATLSDMGSRVQQVRTITKDQDDVDSVTMVNATTTMRGMLDRADRVGLSDARLSELARRLGAV